MHKICVVGFKGYIGSEVFFRLRMMGLNPIGVDMGDTMPKSDITINLSSNIYGQKPEDFLPEIERTKEVITRTSQKIIYTSSAAVYGNCDKPCREKQELNPINDYGKAKLTCEKLIQNCFKGKHSILRLANVYSKEADHGFVANLLRYDNTLYDHGQRIRDYIHLHDVVRVIIEAALTDKWNGIYNIGTGKGQMAKAIFKRLSKEKPLYVKKKEIEYSVLDIRKAWLNGFRPFEI